MIARALAARPEIAGQLLRFLLVGIANTAVGLGTIYLAKYGLGFEDLPANLTGYMLGLCLSFGLNRRWTFRDDGALWPTALRFLAAFAAAYALNLAAFLVATRRLGVVPDLGHVLGMIVYTGAFFVLSRLMVFTSGARRALPWAVWRAEPRDRPEGG